MTKKSNKPAASSGSTIQSTLDVIVTKEGKYYVAFSPALQLSSYGDTPKEAQSAFDEALEIFFEETSAKGTLERELISLGWTLSKANYLSPYLPAETMNMMYPLRKDVTMQRMSISIPFYPVH